MVTFPRGGAGRSLPLRSPVVDDDGLSPYGTRLLRLMTGPAPDSDRCTGVPPDPSRLTDTELGTLFAAAWDRPDTAAGAAILDAARHRSPAFGPAACRVLFVHLAAGPP